MRDINEPLFTFKEKEMLPHAPTGMSLEDKQAKWNKPKKDKYYAIPLIRGL